jgi:4-diphosphocytidyl-2-C-methyl-D-erythritol kinase
VRELSELAPAKINVCLYLGPARDDGRHELVSVMQSIDLADRLTLRAGDGPADEVRCPGIEGPNLAAAALAAFRDATGWDGPPQLLEIEKRVPVAGGVGGGSADAAATLRLASRRSGLGDADELQRIAAALGADVPSQLRPGRVLARGAGERIRVLPDANPCGLLVLRSTGGLSTAAVYAEADRLGLCRSMAELDQIAARLDTADPEPINDLQAAAISLDPTIERRLAQAREAGASRAWVTGSGPTVIGLFPNYEQAADAANQLTESAIDAQASIAHAQASIPWHNPTSP